MLDFEVAWIAGFHTRTVSFLSRVVQVDLNQPPSRLGWEVRGWKVRTDHCAISLFLSHASKFSFQTKRWKDDGCTSCQKSREECLIAASKFLNLGTSSLAGLKRHCNSAGFRRDHAVTTAWSKTFAWSDTSLTTQVTLCSLWRMIELLHSLRHCLRQQHFLGGLHRLRYGCPICTKIYTQGHCHNVNLNVVLSQNINLVHSNWEWKHAFFTKPSQVWS